MVLCKNHTIVLGTGKIMHNEPICHPNRRNIIASAASFLAAALVSEIKAEGGAEYFPAIDTHTHFYDPTRPQGIPWPGKGDPVLYRKVMPAEFQKLTAPYNVQSTIIVEASAWVEDNQWLLDLAKGDKFIAGIVGRLDPADKEFSAHWKRFAKNPLYVGIRVNHSDLQKGLGDKSYLENLRMIASDQRQLDVNGGPATPVEVAKLAKLIPDLRIVINHEANLVIDGKDVPKDWLEAMQLAASNKNVFCKVSALAEGTRKTMGDAPKDLEFYKPVLDSLWNVFGEDRLIFGSNWPVSVRAATYATIHRIVHTYFSSKGKVAAEKYFMKNAIAAYKPPTR
jgi:L-fuconolactonase